MKIYARLTLVIYYLQKEFPHLIPTGRTIYNAQDEAIKYFDSKLPKEFHDTKAKIITDGGFDNESWKNVLQESRAFYFLPDAPIEKVNQAIKELCKKYIMIGLGSIDSENMCFAHLSNLWQRGTIKRIGTKPYTYYLKPETIGELDTYFANL